MDLQQLSFVVETAKTGSINKAARNLYVSQPNLSKSIASLEKELHITLFTRTAKGVTLTEEGNVFMQYAQSMLTQFNDIKRRYENRKNEQQVIRLATNRIPFVSEILMELFNDTLRDVGRVSILLKEISSQRIYDELSAGSANLAVVSFYQANSKTWIEFLKCQNIEEELLFRNGVDILMREGHPLLELEKVMFEDLQKYPLIQVFEPSVPPNFSLEIEMLRYKEFPKIIHASGRGAIGGFLAKTDAIYFTTSFIRSRGPSYPQTTAIPLPDCFPVMTWEFYLLKLKNKLLSQAEHELMERLRAVTP